MKTKKITKASDNCIRLIKRYEGFRKAPYKCPKGVATVGYGSTRYEDGTKVKLTDPPISTERAEALLKSALRTFELLVDNLTRDDLNQNEFDALVSFAYNAGTHYIERSSGKKKPYMLWEHVNNRISREDMDQYWKTLAITSGGVVLSGLKKRRVSEVELFLS